MIYLVFYIFILSSMAIYNAHETYIPNARHPDVKDRCYLKETGDFVDFNQSISPKGICARYTCRDDFVVQVDECSRFMQPDNCMIVPRDLNHTFPDCCPKLNCIDNDGNIEIRNTSG